MIRSKALIYRKLGDPRKVLKLEHIEINAEPGPNEVLVQWISSPINPLDINRIQGQYAIKQEPPVIGGSEGIGKVIKTGPGSHFKLDEHVTIFSSETPFWSEFGIVQDDELVRVDNRIPIPLAATLMINPPTAWIMLKKFENLKVGDFVIQNSANSGVGRSVIEIAKSLGFRTINIVRNRERIDELKTDLWKIGADHVFTEEEFAENGKKFIESLGKKPRLALNGVGGRSALQISSALEMGGTCVTYGGMSKKAHEFSTSTLVFNGITVRGIAVGMWARSPGNHTDWDECVTEIQRLAVERKITAVPMEQVKIDDFQTAIEKSMTPGGKTLKQLIVMSDGKSKI